MSLRFYHNGIETFVKKLKEKIYKDSRRCWWHDESEKRNKDFTGYVDDDGICYDVCHCVLRESRKKYELREKHYIESFLKIKNTVLASIEEISKFIDSITDISEIKSKIRSIKKKLENGYVTQDFKVRGGKKTRRYKKDNRRFLTDREISDLKEELPNLDHLETELSKKIKFEEILGKVIYDMYHINEMLMHEYNNRFEWHETVGLYKDYLNILNTLKLKINHFTFNNIKEKYEIQKKELDTTLEDVTIFEETFEKVMERVEEDKKIEEMMTVKDERQVTKKAKFYIDKNGNRIELNQDVNQVVIHR